MAGGGPGGPSSITIGSLFEARLQRDSATQISVRPYKGRFIGVNGEIVDVLGGFTLSNVANLIDGAGADTGAGPAINTLYYCYVSNTKATFSPSGIRLSGTPPSLVGGVKYLNVGGNGLNWRFVGWVYTISNGGVANFVDNRGTGGANTPQRFIVNYYNRILVGMLCCPSYANDNAATFYTVAPGLGAWGAIDAANYNSEFISNGEDAVHFDLAVSVRTISVAYFGVGETSITVPATQIIAVTANETVSAGSDYNPPEGNNYLSMMCINFNAQATVYADLGRNGTAVDEYSTYLTSSVFV